VQDIRLTGFEEELADWIAAGFAFTPATPPVPAGRRLIDGRTIHVNDMPEDDEIQAADDCEDFEPENEPVVALYTMPGPGCETSTGRHPMHEWTVRLELRCGTVLEAAKRLLEELVTWIVKGGSNVTLVAGGQFAVKKAFLIFRPVVGRREGDDHAYATATLRFQVVTQPA
jgi:hypothetical protein